MGKFIGRIIPKDFWTRREVIDNYTTEDKLVYIYLIANAHTTQAGIFPLTHKQIAFEVGYSDENIITELRRLEKDLGVIVYSMNTQEVAALDFLKNLTKGGKPIDDNIIPELRSVEDETLILRVYAHMSKWWDKSIRPVDHHVKDLFAQEIARRKVPKEELIKYKININKKKKKSESYNDSSERSSDFLSIPTDSSDYSIGDSLKSNAQNLRNAQGDLRKSAQTDAHKKAQKLSNAQIEEEFEGLWKKYPNKKDKKRAFSHYKAWRKASPSKHTPEYLYKRLDLYIQDLHYSAKHGFKRATLNGSTWFNGRFDDEYEIEKLKKKESDDPYSKFVKEQSEKGVSVDVNDDDLPF